MCKDCGYINLKNCCVKDLSSSCFSSSFTAQNSASTTAASNSNRQKQQQQTQYSFQIVPCDGERAPLVFHTKDREDLCTWLNVLQPQSSGSSSSVSVSNPVSIPSPARGSPGYLFSSPPKSFSRPLSSLTALSEEEESEEDEDAGEEKVLEDVNEE